MPVIDTPPPQLLRGSTESDDRLETGMRETEFVTAVEIDHEAKAQYEEQRRQAASGRAETATGIGEPPTADDTDAIEASGRDRDNADAIETAGRARVDADAIADDVAARPPQKQASKAPEGASQPQRASQPPQRVSQPLSSTPPRASQPMIPNIAPITPNAPSAPAAPSTAAAPSAPAAPKLPISTAPASLPPPKAASLPVSGPSPACPQCESPMAWVEEHLRFYCKQCRMYF